MLPEKFKLIFETVAGSYLYGTNTPSSDLDIRGVFIPTEDYFLGLNKVEQYENKKDDITYWEIKKFLRLALDCNPNIIELLFIPDNQIIRSTKEWESIIENRQYFLSKKARWTFSGYAFSQLNRIKKHRQWLLNPPKEQPKREDFKLPKNRSLVPKEQLGAFNKLLSMYLEEIKQFHPLKEQLDEMTETRDFLGIIQSMKEIDISVVRNIMPVSDNLLEVLDKEKRFAQAQREWSQYQNWKKSRNPERAMLEEKYGFDTKHGGHLYRLLTEGEELMTLGRITFPRPDAEFILKIRNGEYDYEDLLDIVGDIDKTFENLYENSNLPYTSNKKKIDGLCVKIVKNYLFTL